LEAALVLGESSEVVDTLGRTPLLIAVQVSTNFSMDGSARSFGGTPPSNQQTYVASQCSPSKHHAQQMTRERPLLGSSSENRSSAVQNGHAKVAEALLVRAANVAATRSNGDTALHWACYRGDLPLVKLLLGYGAPLEAEGEYRNRPLHLACTTNQVSLSAGAPSKVSLRTPVQGDTRTESERCVGTMARPQSCTSCSSVAPPSRAKTRWAPHATPAPLDPRVRPVECSLRKLTNPRWRVGWLRLHCSTATHPERSPQTRPSSNG
jgi:hypothetical protein